MNMPFKPEVRQPYFSLRKDSLESRLLSAFRHFLSKIGHKFMEINYYAIFLTNPNSVK